jgi:hypothetical protein
MLNLVVHIVITGLNSRRSVSCFADLLENVWPVGAATAVSAGTDRGAAITPLFLFESRDQSKLLGHAN